MGARVSEKDQISISAKAFQKPKLTLMLNKPTGYVSMPNDPNYDSAYELIKESSYHDGALSSPDFSQLQALHLSVCGRLDQDSHGLLLFTEDPVLVKKIIGENSRVEKQYRVKVTGDITSDKLQKLCYGLFIDGQKLKQALVTQVGKFELDIVLKEGKKRQIRRMCALVGLQVKDLRRIRIGQYTIGSLPTGKWTAV